MDSVETRRTLVTALLDRAHQTEFGQFLTPAGVAQMMASMLDAGLEHVELLDPGAGIGSLTAAYVAQLRHAKERPASIRATAYEVDPAMASHLRDTLEECVSACTGMGIRFEYVLRQTDFIADCSRHFAEGGLFAYGAPRYNCAILNPPYRKISSQSKTMQLLRGMNVHVSNLYPAFIWLTVRVLDSGGQIVAITPRSFCNGPYFRRFRTDFLSSVGLRRIHVFESRKQAFRDDEVLQENVIVSGVRGREHPELVTVSSSIGVDDDSLTSHDISYDRLILPSDRQSFIRILPSELSDRISQQMQALSTTLADLGLAVSTGRVVEFRAQHLLASSSQDGVAPLIHPCHFTRGYVEWPVAACTKPDALAVSGNGEGLLVPAMPYVLVKRFSAKEERKRIAAAVFDPSRISATQIGFENHLNFIYARDGEMSMTLARGLAAYLNSTLVDEYFRQFSGHTQVNASDLLSLRYPTLAELNALGETIGQEFPKQEELDATVEEELKKMPDASRKYDPLKAKRRITQALDVLRELKMPRQQLNTRSALTLLALLDLKADTAWGKSVAPMRGITEMMEYFREFFGVKYAPNTRETVRRQSVHQFVQSGLVQVNPDDPARPVNSPDTKYQVDPTALELLRGFGTPQWSARLAAYVQTAPKIRALHAGEREQSKIPVTLPDGRKVRLTGGAHNLLIKEVVEKFCPRYTPGGVVVYIGDTGDKLKGTELKYLKRLGIGLDSHGKMPDVIVHHKSKGWLVLFEAVTSHGPMSLKRYNELNDMFKSKRVGLVFVTAFPSFAVMKKYLGDIAWQTEVWVADAPSHLIHFNGERFLGPYEVVE